MSGPVDLLDQLDALRAKATPGPWHVGYESCDEFACGHPDYPCELVGPKRTDPSPNFPQYDNRVSEIAQLTDADAALIVAAVNHLPHLTAAIRAVLDLADEMEAPVAGLTGPVGPLAPLYDGRDVAFRIRAALSGADTGTTA